MSRETILARLQAASRPSLRSAAPTVAVIGASMSVSGRGAALVAAWERLGGTWELHDGMAAARLAVLLRLRTAGVREVLSWPPNQLPVPGLQEAAADAGFRLVSVFSSDVYTDLTIGLTGVDAALAGTGSLVLSSDPHRSWLPVLLPAAHIALVLASQIYAGLDAWRADWEQIGRAEDLGRSLIITGPSTSDDLELHEQRGIFGPAQVHMILIQD